MAANNNGEILEKLKGQELHIPDISAVCKNWETSVNPHKDNVKAVVDEILAKHSVSPQVNAKLTKNMLDTVVSTWYPYADLPTLTDLTYFVCWMFLVDDELDKIVGADKFDESEFERAWDQVLNVVNESCTLDEDAEGGSTDNFPWVESFRKFGETLRKRYTIRQRQRYLAELKATAQAYGAEQRFRNRGVLPDYESYCGYRPGRCCMALVISMIEYANDQQLPDEIMDSPEIKRLLNATTEFLWINNDIMSLKKEIADNFLENLVVIASGPDFQLQNGLDHCIQKLEKTVADIDAAADALFEISASYCRQHPQDLEHGEKVIEQASKFAQNCRSMCLGTVLWSMQTPRYQLSGIPRGEDNSITFTIKTAGLQEENA